MNFQFYKEKLEDAKVFEDFMQKYPDAFPCSAFFVMDKMGADNKQHFDFYSPKENKMFSFALENGVQEVPVQAFKDIDITKISLEHDFDLDDIEKAVEEKKIKEGVNNITQKLLLSMQNIKGKDFLVGTIFVSSMGMIKATISLPDLEILDFEKKSFFDMMNVFKKKKS